MTQENATITNLEDRYPEHDRRAEGYKLTGFVDGAKPANKSLVAGAYANKDYPYGAVPIWRYHGYDFGKKYTGSDVRALRAKYGVGRRENI